MWNKIKLDLYFCRKNRYFFKSDQHFSLNTSGSDYYFCIFHVNVSFSKEGVVWAAHNTSLTLPLFIEVPVPSQESDERSCICVLRVSILHPSAILLLNF